MTSRDLHHPTQRPRRVACVCVVSLFAVFGSGPSGLVVRAQEAQAMTAYSTDLARRVGEDAITVARDVAPLGGNGARWIAFTVVTKRVSARSAVFVVKLTAGDSELLRSNDHLSFEIQPVHTTSRGAFEAVGPPTKTADLSNTFEVAADTSAPEGANALNVALVLSSGDHIVAKPTLVVGLTDDASSGSTTVTLPED